MKLSSGVSGKKKTGSDSDSSDDDSADEDEEKDTQEEPEEDVEEETKEDDGADDEDSEEDDEEEDSDDEEEEIDIGSRIGVEVDGDEVFGKIISFDDDEDTVTIEDEETGEEIVADQESMFLE